MAIRRVRSVRRRETPSPAGARHRTPGPAVAAGLLRVHRAAGNRAAVRLLQRKVTWQETENNSMDPVLAATEGKDWGFTAVLVNGVEDTVDAKQPLQDPKLTWGKTPEGRTELTVAKEAENTIATRMDLPRAPPWTAAVSKSRVGNRIFGDAKELGVDVMGYVTGDGTTNLRVRGKPSDAAMARLTKAHEQHHVDDDVAARKAIVDLWDARVARLAGSGAKFRGDSPQAALDAFYDYVGGSGEAIGVDFFDEVARRGIAYHRTPAGGMPKLVDIGTTPDQSSLAITYQQPVQEGGLMPLFSKFFEK